MFKYIVMMTVTFVSVSMKKRNSLISSTTPGPHFYLLISIPLALLKWYPNPFFQTA